MIDDPMPSDWRELQAGVARLLTEIGLSAKIEHSLNTPRGKVTVDVYAVDDTNLDKTTYIVECKNWDTAIPQSVVHAFTTVMHETGANIGLIVSKFGLQSGSERYTHSTNITGLTYGELQARYLRLWWQKVFCLKLGTVARPLFDLIRPDRDHASKLPQELQAAFRLKQSAFENLAVQVGMMTAMSYGSWAYTVDVPENIADVRTRWEQVLGGAVLEAKYYRPLLDELLQHVCRLQQEFEDMLKIGQSE